MGFGNVSRKFEEEDEGSVVEMERRYEMIWNIKVGGYEE